MPNQYIKNAERSFAFCGTSSSLSGAKGKTLREHFLFYKIPFISYVSCSFYALIF